MQVLLPSELSKFLTRTFSELKGFNKIKIHYRPYICPFHEILPQLSGQDVRIFDIGCGAGTFLSLVDHFVEPSKLAGIDIDSSLIESSKKRVPHLNLKTYDGIHIPNEVDQYNFVTLIDVFHHIAKPQKAPFLEALYKALAPGSTLILKDIDADSWLVYFNKLHDKVLTGEFGEELPLSVTIEMLKQVGFQIQTQSKTKMLWYPHFMIVAQKPA